MSSPLDNQCTAENSASSGSERRQDLPPGADGQLRILVVEDNPINLKVTLMHLKKLGYRADTVVNGLEAVKATQAKDYDVILMDCQMPEMDGYEATRQIRLREAKGEAASIKYTFIVAVTANAMPGDKEKCFMAGMDDFVAKPVESQKLKTAIERAHKKPESEKD
jgi:CheY-like chemotaxis protein